jgi:hypothetical protein
MGPFSIRLVGLDGLRVTCTCGTVLYLHSTCETRRLTCHMYLWDHMTCGTQPFTCHMFLWELSPSPSDLWDPMACVSLVPFVSRGSNKSKKNPQPETRRLECTVFTIALDAWMYWHVFRVVIVLYSLCGFPTGWPILDIFPSSQNKSVPIRLAAADPWCAMVAPAFFWRLGGEACWWSAVELAFVSVVRHNRDDRADPQVSFLAFSYSLYCFGPYLNMRYIRNILALEI